MTALIDHLSELGAGIPGLAFKRMFGGWGMFSDGRMFGLIARDIVYLKCDAETSPLFDAEGLEPFEYDTKSGKHTQMAYRRLPERCLDDAEEFRLWAGHGIAVAARAATKAAKPRAKR